MKKKFKTQDSIMVWKESEKAFHEKIAVFYDDLCLQRRTLNIFINNQRLRRLLNQLPSSQNNIVLDVGCGTGEMMALLENRRINTIGLDLSSEMTKISKKKCPKCEFIVGDAENLPFKEKSFSLTYCIASLHHVPKPKQVIRELIRITKKNEHIYVEEPLNNRLLDSLRKKTKVRLTDKSPNESSFYEDALKKILKDCNKARIEKMEYKMFFGLLLAGKIKNNTLARLIISVDEILSHIPYLNRYMLYCYFLIKVD
jgi:ubiquinone/menaquinone biosynthesis C-methylase UbiE